MPVGSAVRGAAVAFVHYDQIEEITREFLVVTVDLAVLRGNELLVDAQVDGVRVIGLRVFKFDHVVFERGEIAVHGLVDQIVAIREE